MNYVKKHLLEAAVQSRIKGDDRRFFIGAIGIRKDGTKVRSWNGNPKEPDRHHHCEYRLHRKLDRGAIVYISRTLANGNLGLARPCHNCEKVLRNHGVSRAYYSISDTEYGCIEF